MTTIKAMIGTAALAICPSYGAALLATECPDQPQDILANSGGAFSVERGERYAISRGMAVVPVRGLLTPNLYAFERYMGWTTYHGLVETMGELVANDEVSGIVIEFDSPGGMVLGCEGAAQAIAGAAATKPVHGLVHPMAMSAAYWLASQCRDLTLTVGSEVGSIGVMVGSSTPVEPGMDGWQDTEMRSQHARGKNPDLTSEEGRAVMQAELDRLEVEFHAAIARGRGLEADAMPDVLTATDDRRDGGGLFSAQDAIGRGLADTVEDRTNFYNRMSTAYAPRIRPASRAAKAQATTAAARLSL